MVPKTAQNAEDQTGTGKGLSIRRPEAPTAPATVSGERPFGEPLGFCSPGKVIGAQRPASQETGQAGNPEQLSGVTAKGLLMTTRATTAPATSMSANLASPVTAIFLGLTLLFIGGFAGADVLHNSAHDTRHATGFPCH